MRMNDTDTVPARVPLPRSQRLDTASWAALGIVYVLWGSTYLGIKVAIETMPPLLHAAARFLLAGLVVAVVVAVVRRADLRVTRAQLVTASAAGVLLLLGGNGLVTLAERDLSSGLVALLVAVTPIWIVIIRALIGDRPAVLTMIGVGIGFAGVAVLLLAGDGGAGGSIGAGVLAVIAPLCWAAGSVLVTRRPVPANPFVLSAYEMLAGGAALLVAGLATGEAGRLDIGAISARSWWAWVYLVVAGSLVAFTAYVWVLGRAPVSVVSTYAYVNPAIAVVLGALLLGERIGPATLIGGAVIVVAVAVVVTAESRAARPPPTAAQAGGRSTAGR